MRRSHAEERALDMFQHAADMSVEVGRLYGSASEAPRQWLEVADAFEVAADALEEAGRLTMANQANAYAHNIFVTIRSGYGPIESWELYQTHGRRRRRSMWNR